MARRRYQKGSLVPNRGIPANGLWVGRWREDVIQPDGKITRPYQWEVLGTIQDYPTRKLALRALEARLTTINSPTYRARPTATFAEFANRWDATVLSQHKPSTQSSTRSQLRKWLPFRRSARCCVKRKLLHLRKLTRKSARISRPAGCRDTARVKGYLSRDSLGHTPQTDAYAFRRPTLFPL